MKRYISLLLFFSLSFQNIFSQPNKKENKKYDPFHLTIEQKLSDSIQFENFRKRFPDLFNDRRLAVHLHDGSYLVDGNNSDIQINNNYIADSVYHNWHLGTPDTSTLIPYNEIKVTEAKINPVLFFHLILNSSDDTTQAYIDLFPESLIKNGKVDNMPLDDYSKDDYEIRVSINGKIIFDWKKLKNFVKQPYETGKKPLENALSKSLSNLTGTSFKGVSFKGYNYGYNVCDTSLQINDQLLIEIKNSKNNWMVDKYNITRIPIKPFLANIFVYVGEKEQLREKEFVSYNVLKTEDRLIINDSMPVEWKGPDKILKILMMIDSTYFGWEGNGLSMNNKLYPPTTTFQFWFRKPTPDYPDSIQYRLLGKMNNESEWINNSDHTIWLYEGAMKGYNELQVRYKNSPENIASYRWTIQPKWYQTIAFKLVAGVIILLFLILTGIIIHRVRLKKEKERRSKLNMELRSIQSQLNPHFIFNSLGSIQGLINTNKISEANEYLSEFSNLMRNTLIDSDKIFQTLDKEIKILDTYLKLEQLRFEFEYAIKVDDAINKNDTEIPALLLQPLVENAVKHGVSALREKGKVQINFKKGESNLITEIKDNGNGFSVEKESKGYGWKLTDDKIKLLNKMLKGQSIEKKIFRKNDETIAQIIFKNWL